MSNYKYSKFKRARLIKLQQAATILTPTYAKLRAGYMERLDKPKTTN